MDQCLLSTSSAENENLEVSDLDVECPDAPIAVITEEEESVNDELPEERSAMCEDSGLSNFVCVTCQRSFRYQKHFFFTS